LKKPITKKGWWSGSRLDPKFKPQYCQKQWLHVSMFHIHTCTESSSTIFLFPSCYYPPLSMTCFTFLSFIVLGPVHWVGRGGSFLFSVGFALVFYL
jgi:hypothetical protein